MRSLEPIPYSPGRLLTPDTDPGIYAHYRETARALGAFVTLSQHVIDQVAANPDLRRSGGRVRYDGVFRPTRGIVFVYRNPFTNAQPLPYTRIRASAVDDEATELSLPPLHQLVFDELAVIVPPNDDRAPIVFSTDVTEDKEYLRLEYEVYGDAAYYVSLDKDPTVAVETS
jgi:hypothetical protein